MNLEVEEFSRTLILRALGVSKPSEAMLLALAVAALLTTLVLGCTTGPDYKKPDTPMPACRYSSRRCFRAMRVSA